MNMKLALVAVAVADAVISDITDRRGWKQEWDTFDQDVQAEIRSTLEKIIYRGMADRIGEDI